MVGLIFISFIICFSSFAFGLKNQTYDSVLVFNRGEGGYFCHKIPYLYRTFSGILIAMSEGRGKDGRNACDDFSGTDLVYKRSFDDGNTWSPLAVLFANSTESESVVIGNAAPVQDSKTGRIWVPFNRNNEEVLITYSDDDGATWAYPEERPDLVLPEWKWVGLGPPAGLQLTGHGLPNKVPEGRLLIPGYHTVKIKGDGELSKGHTLISDDHGATWQIGSSSFGGPFLFNEAQAVQMANGSVIIHGRTVTPKRVVALSHDGGNSFLGLPKQIEGILEPLEGCEGSTVRDPSLDLLFYTGPSTSHPAIIRQNLTLFCSVDALHWEAIAVIDSGAVSYSALQVLGDGRLGLLYERSDKFQIIFEPDEMRFVDIKVDKTSLPPACQHN